MCFWIYYFFLGWYMMADNSLLTQLPLKQLLDMLFFLLGPEGEARVDARSCGFAVEVMAGVVEAAGHEPALRERLFAMLADPCVRRNLRAVSGHEWPWFQDASVCVQVSAKKERGRAFCFSMKEANGEDLFAC